MATDSAPSPIPPTSNGAFITGGVGALLALGGAALITLPLFQGNVGDTVPAMAGHALIAVGLVLMGWMLLAVVPLTNALARATALEGFLTAGAEVLLALGFAGVLQLGPVFAGLLFLFPLFFAVLGLWGFAALKQLGFLGGVVGATGLLGGVMVIAYHACNLAGVFRRIDDDLALVLVFGGLGLCGLACLAVVSLAFGGHLKELAARASH